MSLFRSGRRLVKMYVLLLLLLCCVACTTAQGPGQKQTTQGGALPGQQIWKDGASSLLFGTNDTYEWSKHNIQTDAAIQKALRDAGFTLVRSFFPDKASDAEIEQRIHTIENIGAHCLGVITSIENASFNEHLVKYLGTRCQMYEFGNESDYNGIALRDYLKQWNAQIPRLRKDNPKALFIGPVTYNDQGNQNFMQGFLQGVKSSGVLPDAISFHWYPCYQDTREECLAKASSYKQVAEGVRSLVQKTLGKALPVGITEWNFDPGNPPPAYGDDADFIKQFSNAAIKAMVDGGVAFACQFDAASYSGYGHLDMFNVDNDQAKPQYYALQALIAQYRPVGLVTPTPVLTERPAMGDADKLVSRGKQVACTGNQDGAGGTGAIVDGHYGNWAFWRTNLAALPSACAIHIGAGPKRLLLVWGSDYVFDYISDQGMEPQEYTISTSADSSDGLNGTWKTVATVMGNKARVREHLIPFDKQSWVRMTVTKGEPRASQPYVTIDEIDAYDVSSNLDDSFFFSGDSITAIATNRFDENQPSFAEDVHHAYPQHFPAMLDGGLGGWNSDGAAQDIDSWLALNPDIHYWLLEWGTNDALQNVAPDHFQANIQLLVDKIKQAGHVPILAHIPAVNLAGDRGTSVNQEIQALNARIDQVTSANGLTAGPDFYTLFQSHASTYFISDGIHPSAQGAIAMNMAWFKALEPVLYKK